MAVFKRMFQRRRTAEAWAIGNPVLAQGEFGYEIGTGKLKIGDGATAWNDLAYIQTDVDALDHGNLLGLDDNDHPQYAFANDLTDFANDLSDEISDRAAADTAEATTRANADTAEATARANADSAEATARADADALLQPLSEKGSADGYAELDSTGRVPADQLPSFVDDVLEFVDLGAFPVTGESGKIYVALDSLKTYRWGGSAYSIISETLALGETSTTAYRGDRGKTAYDHSQTTGNPHSTSKGDLGLGNVDNTSDVNKPVSTLQAAADLAARSAAEATAAAALASSEASTAAALAAHASDTTNVHGFVDAAEVETKVGHLTVTQAVDLDAIESGLAGKQPIRTVVALTDGANIATNAALGDVFKVTLGGNRTIDNPTNPIAGKLLTYRLKQDDTGTRTITWGSDFRFPSGTAPTLTTTASKTDYLGFIYNADDSKWDQVAFVGNF